MSTILGLICLSAKCEIYTVEQHLETIRNEVGLIWVKKGLKLIQVYYYFFSPPGLKKSLYIAEENNEWSLLAQRRVFSTLNRRQ